jgi:hypothetical protein
MKKSPKKTEKETNSFESCLLNFLGNKLFPISTIIPPELMIFYLIDKS